ncbi:hypothetical protein DY926_02425 [Komagataeibacter melaceti]|uniref:Uncharacterized protein n=1 Tax=Komagataeibacter melaceti TaxID=2766577 RepID=A0A371Z3W7_9PROT|nr:hypothetical protein [Komagataeibacter melaceti]RFD21161.1 hypothetical protein DY926_02425 [Komagataeibacter melaceti]
MTNTPDQDSVAAAQSPAPDGVAHPDEVTHEVAQQAEAAQASTDVPDPGPVPAAQTRVVASPDDAVATTPEGAMASMADVLRPYKDTLQLMGAVLFVMGVLVVGWSAMHASGIWPE